MSGRIPVSGDPPFFLVLKGEAWARHPESTRMAADVIAGVCRAYGARVYPARDHPGLPAWAKFCRAYSAEV